MQARVIQSYQFLLRYSQYLWNRYARLIAEYQYKHVWPRLEPYYAKFKPGLAKAKHHAIEWGKSFQKIDPEVEFYPAALEVLETPASPLGRAIGGVIIAFFTIALLWACIGSVDIVATAQGKVIPTGRTKIIQPLEAGVVRVIHVQDGQHVKQGDTLIEIDTTISESERNRLHKELLDAKLNVARLKAALSTSDDPEQEFVIPEGASDAQIATQKSLLHDQINEIRAKLSGLDKQIAQNEGNQAAVQSTIGKLHQSIPMLAERAKMREELSSEGYGSKIETLNAKQDLVEHQQELQVQSGRLSEATAGVESLKAQHQQAEAEFRHTNLDKLAEAEQRATSLQEQWVQAAQKYRLQTLTAPVDGTVQQLSIHTEGGVVTPAQTLLAIVPTNSRVEIEAMVSNRDIGFVRAGQEVEVKVDTFSFTRYGLLRGSVISVSQDAVTREKPSNGDKKQIGVENETSEPQGQEWVYTARVALDQTQMDIDGKMVNITPGMAVTAEIKTGTRHIISYLLSPLQKHAQQAFREH